MVVQTTISWTNIVGNGYVQLLQMIVMPLVFVAILNAVSKLHDASALGKISVLVLGTLADHGHCGGGRRADVAELWPERRGAGAGRR